MACSAHFRTGLLFFMLLVSIAILPSSAFELIPCECSDSSGMPLYHLYCAYCKVDYTNRTTSGVMHVSRRPGMVPAGATGNLSSPSSLGLYVTSPGDKEMICFLVSPNKLKFQEYGTERVEFEANWIAATEDDHSLSSN